MKFTFDEFQALQARADASTRAGERTLNESQRDAFEERAAILEFCAGLSRADAESQALLIVLNTAA